MQPRFDSLVHIGLHKCGSTWLQNQVFPKFGPYMKRNSELDYWLNAKSFSLLSSEGFSGTGLPRKKGDSFERFVNFIRKAQSSPQQVGVLVIVRPASEILKSLYVEKSKRFEISEEFSDYINRFSFQDLSTYERVKLLREVPSLIVTSDQLYSDLPGFLVELQHFLGVDGLGFGAQDISKVRVNISPQTGLGMRFSRATMAVGYPYKRICRTFGLPPRLVKRNHEVLLRDAAINLGDTIGKIINSGKVQLTLPESLEDDLEEDWRMTLKVIQSRSMG